MKRKLLLVLLIITTALCSIFALTACGGGGDKPKTYTITWQNYDGSNLEIDNSVKEGLLPEYNGVVPTKKRGC